MPSLPLQEMIAGAIKTANAKLAAEAPREPEKVKKLLAYEKKEHGHVPTPHEEEEEHEKQASAQLTSSDHVEKLASAVDYIASHLGDIAPAGPIAQALSKVAMKPGAGGGTAGGKAVPSPVHPSGLATTEAIGGKQKYTKNTAKGEQAEDEHKLPLGKARPNDGKTQLDNNMHDAPGGGGLKPTGTYPAKGPMVAGPSGAHDKGVNGAKTAGMVDKAMGAVGNQVMQHPHAAKAAVGAGLGGAVGAVGGAAGAESGHRMGGALKGGLAGGLVGGVAGSALHKAGPQIEAAAQHLAKTAQEKAHMHILLKLAGEDVMKAHIEGGGTVSPLAGKGQLKTMEAGQQSPTQGGGNAGGNESRGAGLVGSNKGAIDYTKRDAKKLVVEPLKAVLEQPAFSEKHDNKLQENLRNTGKAGVKIAGVRAELAKVASAGCTCNGKSECQFCTMRSKLAEMGGAGGGMSPMADGGAGHDGCTCGHTGECRVCKLSAAMSAAKGGHPGETTVA